MLQWLVYQFLQIQWVCKNVDVIVAASNSQAQVNYLLQWACEIPDECFSVRNKLRFNFCLRVALHIGETIHASAFGLESIGFNYFKVDPLLRLLMNKKERCCSFHAYISS